jgi:hypothetical protein
MQYAWEQPLREAQSETDLEKVEEKCSAAESAMWNRMRELDNSPADNAEREAMKQAAQELLKIRSEKLGWPGLSS